MTGIATIAYAKCCPCKPIDCKDGWLAGAGGVQDRAATAQDYGDMDAEHARLRPATGGEVWRT